MVIEVDKVLNLSSKIIWKKEVLEKNAVSKNLVQTLNITLDLGVVRYATRVLHTFTLQLFSQVAKDIA